MSDSSDVTIPHGWAVPSWVMPGTVAENCRFLAGRAEEVALCFFETAGTLAFGTEDLPAPDDVRGMRFHVHLPMDLDWGAKTSDQDADRAGRACARQAFAVFQVAARLLPRLAVLHPPVARAGTAVRLLKAFLAEWQTFCGARVLLENTSRAPVADIMAAAPELFADQAYGFCLDVGHLLRYHPQVLEDSALLAATRMVHWNVLGERGRHLALTRFTAGDLAAVRQLVRHLPDDCCHVLEIFDWSGITASIPVLRGLLHAGTDSWEQRGDNARERHGNSTSAAVAETDQQESALVHSH